MMDIPSKDIQEFQQKILTRYKTNKRDLPWRDCGDPYWVLVSEVMLQQTQVDRVVPKFLAFLRDLPALQDLAEVDRHTLLGLWSGLGFNSRAIRLQQAAQIILDDFGGSVPQSREELLQLPGIGPYCSASIMAFAYNLPAPVVDTNIRRVLISELGLDESLSPAELEAVAFQCIPEGRSNDRHNALMDYGATVATARKTGIKPVSQQSPFAGSVREARGMIMRYLLRHRSATKQEILTGIIHQHTDAALKAMISEGFVNELDGVVTLG